MARRAPAAQIRSTLEDLVSTLDGMSPHMAAVVTLARAVADELDSGQTANAALVKQYRDLLELLNDDDGAVDPIADLLAKLRDTSPAGASDQG